MPCAKTSQHFAHVINGELVGQGLQAMGLVEVKRDAGDGKTIKQHIAGNKAMGLLVIDWLARAEVVTYLFQGHAPGKALHACLNPLSWPADQGKGKNPDQNCMEPLHGWCSSLTPQSGAGLLF